MTAAPARPKTAAGEAVEIFGQVAASAIGAPPRRMRQAHERHELPTSQVMAAEEAIFDAKTGDNASELVSNRILRTVVQRCVPRGPGMMPAYCWYR